RLGISIPAATLRNFWSMLSHYHGQVLNYSELARSFGVSDMTVRRYIDILEGTYVLRVLKPWFNNTRKRLVRSPKIYLRDSGIFHGLQGIGTERELMSHNKLGASWEGFALEETISVLKQGSTGFYFWAAHASAEIDLFFVRGGVNCGVEFKFQDAPSVSRSMKTAIRELELHKLLVIYPGDKDFPLTESIEVLSLSGFRSRFSGSGQ
ncbi:MAG: DUF4143 domain-containing protein, partial [Candidatus Wallbacteria bacterium]|nr:DUF4143 domain-containing protein [Candidatus Wallbacteria bacterium]